MRGVSATVWGDPPANFFFERRKVSRARAARGEGFVRARQKGGAEGAGALGGMVRGPERARARGARERGPWRAEEERGLAKLVRARTAFRTFHRYTARTTSLLAFLVCRCGPCFRASVLWQKTLE